MVQLQQVNIGSANGLALNRRKVITWTNVAQFTDEFLWHSGEMSLSACKVPGLEQLAFAQMCFTDRRTYRRIIYKLRA